MIPLAGAAAVLLWRRAARPQPQVDLVYDDGSAIRLEHGIEAESLLGDAKELVALLK